MHRGNCNITMADSKLCDILFVRSHEARPSSVPPKLELWGGQSSLLSSPVKTLEGTVPPCPPMIYATGPAPNISAPGASGVYGKSMSYLFACRPLRPIYPIRRHYTSFRQMVLQLHSHMTLTSNLYAGRRPIARLPLLTL